MPQKICQERYNIITSLTFVCRVSILLILPVLSAGFSIQAQTSRIIPENAELEKVFGEGFSTEGPAEAPDGSIYFSDQTFTSESNMQAGHIWRFDPNSGRTVIFRSPSGMANGMKFDIKGRMVVAEGADFGGRCLVRTDMQSGKSIIIAGLYDGKAFNSPNDLAIDEKGRVYFTDPRYVGHEAIEQPVMGVYRLDTTGKVTLIISDIGMPNGIAVSPDQNTLYVGCFDEGTEGDSAAGATRARKMVLLAYDLSPFGEAAFRKIIADFGSNDGPDGITVDKEGNIYVAVRNESRPGIYVYTPEGKEITYIATPEVPSNAAFSRHGNERYLYITAGRSLYRISTLSSGYFNLSK